MSKKEKFIEEVENLMFEAHKNLSNEAMAYFEALKGQNDKEKPLFTEKGKMILQFFQENADNYNNMLKAKDIASGMGIVSKSIAGSCKKLIADGYLEKLGDSPIVYSITEKGRTVNLTNL